MPKTKRRRCKAGCEPAAPRGPRDQRVPSCPCSPAASRVPARSWGAGDPETPRDRSKESATEAARPWSGGGHTWKREGAQGPRRASPCFPLLSSHVAPSAPFPQTRLQTPDAATHSAPPAQTPPSHADDRRGLGTGDAVAGTGRADGRCRIHVPAPRRSPAPAGKGTGLQPACHLRTPQGSFPALIGRRKRTAASH